MAMGTHYSSVRISLTARNGIEISQDELVVENTECAPDLGKNYL